MRVDRMSNETEARRLSASLAEVGVVARVEGAGVHWRVDVDPADGRSLRIHCFWHERQISALMLGMNPSNQRSRLRATHEPYEGPEFVIELHGGDAPVANGRTFIAAEVIACVRAWLSGTSLDELVRAVPFVNQRLRAMQALA